MDRVRDEVVAEGVHEHEGYDPPRVPVVVQVLAARHARAGRRLDRGELHVPRRLPLHLVVVEGLEEAGEATAAADAPEYVVGVIVGHRDLLLRLLPYDRLVHEHVVEDAPQAVLRPLVPEAGLNGLTDGDAQAAGAVGVLSEDLPPDLRSLAGARVDVGSVELHHHPPVGLLLVADADHVDLDFDVEEGAAEGERRAPLARAGLGGEPLDALPHVVVGLGDRRVGLVAPRRAGALVLVVYPGRCLQGFLEAPRPINGRRPVETVHVPYLFRYLYEPLPAHLLPEELLWEERLEGPGVHWLLRRWIQNGLQGRGEVG